MKISESAVDDDSIAELTGFASSVYAILPKTVADIEPIVLIDEIVYDWQRSGVSPLAELEPDDLIYAIGTLWGNIVVEKYDWRWATLTFHQFNDWKGRAVVSGNGSLAILPFAHIHECLAGNDEVKISASIAALGSDMIPAFPPNSYENVMHGIQRIVPRG